MKPENIRNAFKVISLEAQNDKTLTSAVSEVSAGVPVQQLKALFWQFMLILLPALILYFAVSMIPAGAIPSLPELDSTGDTGTMIFHNGMKLFASGDFFILWFIRGILRGFLILGVFAFILTAAAMPVKRPEEIQGGSVCEA